MWTPLALVAALALAPGQAGGLALTNARSTYGELGGTRPTDKLLPGDILFVGFDIEGIAVDKEGKFDYSMALEVQDAAGKAIFKQEPADKSDFLPLGGTRLPARAFITAGLDQPAGVYTLKVTVKDKKTQAARTLDKRFEVLPKDFGIVAVYASVNEQGSIPAPTTGVVGQSVFVQYGVVGFGRDAAKKQPDMVLEMAVLDADGTPTLPKPAVFPLTGGVEEQESTFTLRFLLPLNRVGKYTVRLTARDNVLKRTATFDLPMAVVPSAN